MKLSFSFFKKRQTVENDLQPKGIAKTIKSANHGTAEHHNEAWKTIYSQRRNLDIL